MKIETCLWDSVSLAPVHLSLIFLQGVSQKWNSPYNPLTEYEFITMPVVSVTPLEVQE